MESREDGIIKRVVSDAEDLETEFHNLGELDYQLVKVHLFAERLLDRLIASQLHDASQLLKKGHLNFHQKYLLVRAFGVLNQQATDGLKKLNEVRNKVVHDIGFHVGEADVELIGRTQGRRYTAIKNEHSDFLPGQLWEVAKLICIGLSATLHNTDRTD